MATPSWAPEPNRLGAACCLMTGKAELERPGPPADVARAKPKPLPEDQEKLRLRFELELFQSQNAGAALDPLLRRSRRAHREPDPV